MLEHCQSLPGSGYTRGNDLFGSASDNRASRRLLVVLSLSLSPRRVMPEELECLVHVETVKDAVKTLGPAQSNRTAVDMWLDHGSKDTCPHPKDGHVFTVGPESRFERGNNGSQTRLAPQEILRTKSNPNPPTFKDLGLVLQEVHGNARMIVLVFSGARAFAVSDWSCVFCGLAD